MINFAIHLMMESGLDLDYIFSMNMQRIAAITNYYETKEAQLAKLRAQGARGLNA